MSTLENHLPGGRNDSLYLSNTWDMYRPGSEEKKTSSLSFTVQIKHAQYMELLLPVNGTIRNSYGEECFEMNCFQMVETLRCVHTERLRQRRRLWMGLEPIFKYYDQRHSVCIVN